MKNIEIYRFINYLKQKSFLFCLQNDKYIIVKDFGSYVVGANWMSSSEPIEFIANQCRSINSETSTGVHEIKRVFYKNLPNNVKNCFKQINI